MAVNVEYVPDVYPWHKCEVPTGSGNVRCSGLSDVTDRRSNRRD